MSQILRDCRGFGFQSAHQQASSGTHQNTVDMLLQYLSRTVSQFIFTLYVGQNFRNPAAI
jgi:hypothetical protein